jgi:hypothetical protein
MKTVSENLKTVVVTATLSFALSSFAGTTLAGETEAVNSPSVLENSSEFMRDYLSDPRRTGSLAGSVIGGALSAHPAGPILGGLVGFFVGKRSMFNEDKTRNQQEKMLYAKRDIVPQAGQPAATLSFANAQGITFDTAPAVGAPTTPAGFSRTQIAAICGGGQALSDPRLRSLCFYSQGS